MEAWLQSSIHWLLLVLALPKVGLAAIFVVSLVGATLLPLASEPAVFGFVQIAPHMFWPAVLVATLGNTLGGMISYVMGEGAEKVYEHWHEKHGHLPQGRPGCTREVGGRWHGTISACLHRMGPPVLFFAWLPVVGDPLCAVAGWMRLPFWPSAFYMAIGKLLRYVVMTVGLLWAFPHL